MRTLIACILLLAASALATPSLAQEPGIAKPNLLRRDLLTTLPKGATQELRVFTASFKPGDRTVLHTHRFPVTVYILEGAFTLEMEGHELMTVKAGESMVEPPHVKMTGYNRSTTEPLRLVIFYVSDPDTPFLDIVK